MQVKSESEVAQSCPTLSDPMDCSPPGSSIHGIFQARELEWGAIAFSGFSPSLVQIGETSWILDSEMSLKLQGADIVSYLLCDFGQGYEMHWALVSYQENGK